MDERHLEMSLCNTMCAYLLIGRQDQNFSSRRSQSVRLRTSLIVLCSRLNTADLMDPSQLLNSTRSMPRLVHSRSLLSLRSMRGFRIQRPMSLSSIRLLLRLEAKRRRKPLDCMRRHASLIRESCSIDFLPREQSRTQFLASMPE